MLLHLFSLSWICAVASAATAILIVLSQRWHGKHTLDHDLDGVQKFHTTAVPRIGGFAVFAALLVPSLMHFAFSTDVVALENLKNAQLLIACGLPVFLAGTVEDLTKRVTVRVRLTASILSALMASVVLGNTLTQLNIWGVDSLLEWAPLALVVTAVVVAGGVNAVNIIDGFNGLASGTVIVMLAALGAIAFYIGDTLVAELAILGIGATAGFLLINYPAGRLFLGDGGAYFLGFWVAELAVMLLVRNPSVSAWQVLSVCAYPIIEVLYSMYRRRVIRQSSPGSPDGLHLHTLVYRRFVSRYSLFDNGPTWKRNAAVACVILPWITIAGFCTVMIGNSNIKGIMLVVTQFVTYLAVYSRLVRGRWVSKQSKILIEHKSREESARAGLAARRHAVAEVHEFQ